MSLEIDTAIVVAFASLLVSLITFAASERKLRQDKTAGSQLIAQKFVEQLLQHRLRLYPKAFTICDPVGKGDADNPDLPKVYETARTELKSWKTGEVSCVISVEAEDRYYELHARLKKNPGRGTKYEADQIQKIFDARQKFLGALRRDLGLLHASSRLRLHLPEDDQADMRVRQRRPS